jgi:hypothetical protein
MRNELVPCVFSRLYSVLDNDFGVSRFCYDRRIRSSLGMFLSNHLIVYTSAQNLVSTPNISKVMYDDQGLNGGGLFANMRLSIQ